MNKINFKITRRPSFNLEKAITMADTIYKKYSTNFLNDEILSQILGHQSKQSGSYHKNKSGLCQYGLLIKTIDDKNKNLLKISENYIKYVKASDQTKKNKYLEIFFNHPPIYKSIRRWFPDLENINKKALIMQIVWNKKVDEHIGKEVAENFIQSLDYLNLKKSIHKSENFIPLNQDANLLLGKTHYEINNNETPNEKYNDPINETSKLPKLGQTSTHIMHEESMLIGFSLPVKELSKIDLTEAIEILISMKSKLDREIERRFPKN